ncbi:MAG: flagellar basal body-associated FliL family protein [Acetobacteraceae bacterium]
MAEAGRDEIQGDGAPAENAPAPRRKGRRGMLLAAAGIVVLLAGGGGAYFFVPQVGKTVQSLIGTKAQPGPTATAGPVFIDMPEMAVTLANGGHSRQMRIRMSIELAKTAADMPVSQFLSPRVYDALLTYLRTLRDGELDGGLAIDRMRADLYRRLNLVFGPGVVADVLITGLVLA